MNLISILKISVLAPYPAASCFLPRKFCSSLSVISNIPFLQPLLSLKSIALNYILSINLFSRTFFITYIFWSTPSYILLLIVSIHLSSCSPVNHLGNTQNINPSNYLLLFDDLWYGKKFCEDGDYCKSIVSLFIWKVTIKTIIHSSKGKISWKNGNNTFRKYPEDHLCMEFQQNVCGLAKII